EGYMEVYRMKVRSLSINALSILMLVSVCASSYPMNWIKDKASQAYSYVPAMPESVKQKIYVPEYVKKQGQKAREYISDMSTPAKIGAGVGTAVGLAALGYYGYKLWKGSPQNNLPAGPENQIGPVENNNAQQQQVPLIEYLVQQQQVPLLEYFPGLVDQRNA